MTDLLLEYLLCGFPVTSSTVRKADKAMARTAKGLCGLCGEPVNEDGICTEESCR